MGKTGTKILFHEPRPARAARSEGGGLRLPSTVVEIQPGFVAAGRLRGSGRMTRLARLRVRELAPGAVRPGPHHANIADPAELDRAVGEIAEGARSGRLALLIPDAAVRVAVLSFESLPPGRKEVEDLVRWRLKDAMPFPPEDVRASFQVSWQQNGSVELLAVAARRQVLEEYERAVSAMNSGAAIVLPATLALVPLLPPDENRAQLLIHLCSGWMTVVALESGRLRLWRSRRLEVPDPAEAVKEAALEAGRVAASVRDRTKAEVSEAWLCARPPLGDGFLNSIGKAIGGEANALEPNHAMAASLPSLEQVLFERYGAAYNGIAANTP